MKDELKVRESLVLVEKSSESIRVIKENKSERNPEKRNRENEFRKAYQSRNFESNKCLFCGKSDHVSTSDHRGRNVIEYFACEKFAKSSPKERIELLRKKGLCKQCLYPGALENTGTHKTGQCYNKFCCKNELHKKYDRKWHVLLCDIHKNDEANLALLNNYKKEKIFKIGSELPDYSKQIRIAFHLNSDSEAYKGTSLVGEALSEVQDSSIYVLQTIKVESEVFRLFFDSGCGDLVGKKSAIDTLKMLGRANQVIPGPIPLFGVGNQRSQSDYGVYNIQLPLHNEKEAIMSGIILDNVTKAFPVYPLSEVEKDIHQSYKSNGSDPGQLPKLPHHVGGETDIMIGIKYLKYFPERVFQLPNGLTIYKSMFRNSDGSRGVIGGPHRIFTEIERQQSNYASMEQYCVEQVKLVKFGYKVSLDIPLLSVEGSKESSDIDVLEHYPENTFYSKRQSEGQSVI